MIDFHSHILPGIDDGSASVEESVALLKMLRAQQVRLVFATPHFYIQNETPQQFLRRREEAFSRLRPALSSALPRVRLGAEVYYFSGISNVQNLLPFCLEGTNILLLEMPFCTWTSSVFHELMELSCCSDVTVLLAHIERYLSLQKPDLIARLFEHGVLFQTNAGFFAEKRSRRKALKMLKAGWFSAVGSDCHNLAQRPPQFDLFAAAVQKSLGDDFLESFLEAQSRFLEESACEKST